MKGKLRKIGLGMFGLMCAGTLFTCVLPAKAAMCQHITYMYLGWSGKYVDKDDYDSVGHYIKRDERGACGICGEEFAIQTVIVDKKYHDLVTTTYWNKHYDITSCTECNYEYTSYFD